MSEKSERISATVTPETKSDFKIAAMRRDMKEAELLRELIGEFLEEENIPDEVRGFFKERQEGNPKTTATAD